MKVKRKGLTLIELIIVIALTGLILGIPSSMYLLSQKSHTSASREFAMQSNVRIMSQKLTSIIRTSSAIFLLEDVDKVFKDNTVFGIGNDSVVLDSALLNSNTRLKNGVEKYKGWSFIVLDESGKELREFRWTITGSSYTQGYYTMSRIIENQQTLGLDLNYSITYEKTNPYYDDALVKFSLDGKRDGSTESVIKVDSEVESLNSLQVIDRGKEASSVSTVIFFRSDDRPLPNDKKAIVSMVLDESGSMADNMNGGSSTSASNPSRLSILKTQAKDMVDNFKNNSLGETHINLIPFDSTANFSNDTNYSKFLDAKTENISIKSMIDALSAGGGTNVGDGMRRAYFNLKKYNDGGYITNPTQAQKDSNKNDNKYIIVLMDGVPTFYTAKGGSGESRFYFGDGNVNSSNDLDYYGPGNSSNNLTRGYIGKISQTLLTQIKDTTGTNNLKVFVIGFSADTSINGDLADLSLVTSLIGNNVYSKQWIATNGGDLSDVFTEIRNIIIEDTWHIDGPKLEVDP